MHASRQAVLLFALSLAGCATQMVQEQAKNACEKQGKRALVISSEHSGIPLLIESAGATYYCVRPEAVVHTREPFGVDAVSIGDVPGAAVLTVAAGSPAAKAGLRNGDVIYEYAGHAIADADQLQQAVAETPGPQPVLIKLRRNDKEVAASVQF